MALPADLDLIPVRGKYVRLDGTPVTGNVSFATTNVLTDAASLTTVVPATLTATLDAGGAFTINLPASNDPDVTPTGWTYTVTENFAGGRSPYAITVPVAAKGTGVDLATVAPNPTAASAGDTAYVLLASFTQALRVTDAILRWDGTGTQPLRTTATTDTLRPVRWRQPVAPPTTAGYAITGLDVWEKTQ